MEGGAGDRDRREQGAARRPRPRGRPAAGGLGNDAAGIAALAERPGPGARDLPATAASGGYERLPHRLLSGRAVPVAVVNAARVRDFGRAGGRAAETDRLDAELIAPATAPSPGRRRRRW